MSGNYNILIFLHFSLSKSDVHYVLQNDRERSEPSSTDHLAVKMTKQSTSKQHRCIRFIRSIRAIPAKCKEKKHFKQECETIHNVNSKRTN